VRPANSGGRPPEIGSARSSEELTAAIQMKKYAQGEQQNTSSDL
jgi:hypothetical protein